MDGATLPWMVRFAQAAVFCCVLLLHASPPALAAEEASRPPAVAAAERSVWQRVLWLEDYNTRVVLLGTTLLGMSGGVVGTFTLLRRRALVSDVVSHCSLPGVAIAFLVMETWRAGSGKSLPGLLVGAALAGLLGILSVQAIGRWTRIKQDAALAIVLSVFYGLGIALFTVVQRTTAGNVAGLQHFIFGQPASLVARDCWLVGGLALITVALCVLLFKEFALLAFDGEFAAAQGWPVGALDLLLLTMVVAVTVVGLQSVGLLLVVALLITPAAAARFWTDRLSRLLLISAVMGGTSAAGGALLSALFPRIAAGAVIVLVGSAWFVVSLLFGLRRGIVRRWWVQRGLRRQIGRDDLLRTMYECVESTETSLDQQTALTGKTVLDEQLLAARGWSQPTLRRLAAAAVRARLLERHREGYRLTPSGAERAWRSTRNHRLWEEYLISSADMSANRVDRMAEMVEHVLAPEVVEELERTVARQYPHLAMPPSVHPLAPPAE